MAEFGNGQVFNLDLSSSVEEMVTMEEKSRSLLTTAQNIEQIFNGLAGDTSKMVVTITKVNEEYARLSELSDKAGDSATEYQAKIDELRSKIRELLVEEAENSGNSGRVAEIREEIEAVKAEREAYIQLRDEQTAQLASYQSRLADIEQNGSINETVTEPVFGAKDAYDRITAGVNEYKQALVALANVPPDATPERLGNIIGMYNEAANALTVYTRLFRELTGQEQLQSPISPEVATAVQNYVNDLIKGFTDAERSVVALESQTNGFVTSVPELMNRKRKEKEAQFANPPKEKGVPEFLIKPETLEEVDERIEALKNKIEELRNMTSGESPVDVTKIASQITEAEKELKKYEKIKETVTGQSNKPSKKEEEQIQPFNFQEARERLRALPKEIQQERAKIKGSDDIEGQVSKVKKLESEYSKLKSILSDAKGGTYFGQLKESFANFGSSPALKAVKATASSIGSALQKGAQVAIGALKAYLSAVKQLATGALQATQMIAKGVSTALVSGAKFATQLTASITRASAEVVKFGANALQGVASGAMQVGGALSNLVSGGFNLLASGAKAGFNGLKQLGAVGFNLVRAGAERAKVAVQGIIGKFKSLGGDATKKLTKSLMSIKSMLMRRIKRTFISAIFNQAKEGLQSLAKQDEAFNRSMSNIKNSAKGAAGNLAVTLGSLVQIIEPVLTRIINLFSKVLTYINALLAKFTGAKTMMVAKESTDDYAKSLNKAGKAADNATGKFDELNVIGNDSGGGGGSGGIEYEQQEIESLLPAEIKKMYDDLFKAINAQQWEEAGRVVGNFANTLLDTFSSKLVEWRKVTTEYAEIGARFLNGLLEALDFHKVGEIIGNGVNLIADTLNTFLTKFDFKQLGSKLGDKIRGIFDTVDFTLLGQTLGNVVNAIWSTLEGYVSNLPYEKIGSRLAEGINSWGKTIKFDTVSRTIVNGINGLSDTIYSLVHGLDLSDVAKAFGKSISDVFTGIKWTDLGIALGSGVSVIVDALDDTLTSINFGALGSGLASGINGLFDSIDWDKLGSTFATYYNSIFDVIYGFVDQIDFNEVAKDLSSGINGFIDNINWDKLSDAFITGVNKLIPAIADFAERVKWDKLATDIAQNLNKAIYNINWEDLGSTLGTLVNKLFGTISRFLDEFDFGSLGLNLGLGLKRMLESINWSDVANSVSNGFNGLIDIISGFLSSNVLVDLASNLGSTINQMFSQIKWDELSDIINNGAIQISDAFSKFVEKLGLSDLAENLGKLVNNFFADDGTGESPFVHVVKNVNDGIKNVADAFSTFVDTVDFKTIGDQLAEGVNSFFMKGEDGKSPFDSCADVVVKGIKGVTDAFDGLLNGENKIDFEGISNSISEKINSLITEVDWAQLLVNIGTFCTKVQEAFWNVIATVNFTELASELASGVNKLFAKDEATDKTPLESILERASAGLNNIISAFRTFVIKINLASIRESLVNGINTLLTETDWGGEDGLLAVVGQFLIDVHDEFWKLIGEINFTQLAKDLASSVNTLFAVDETTGKTPFEKLASSVSDGVNNVIKAFMTLVNGDDEGKGKLDFEQIGASLARGIQTLITNIDFSGLIDAIGTGITTVADEFFKLVTKVFNPQEEGVKSLGDQLADGINGIFKNENNEIDYARFEQLGQDFGEAVKSVFSDIKRFLKETDWKAIGKSIGTALASVDWIGVAKDILDLLWNALVGAVEAIGGLFSSIIKKLFGIDQSLTFDNEAHEWSASFAESLEKSFESGDVKQKAFAAAAGFASETCEWAADSLVYESNSYVDEMTNTIANGVDTAFANMRAKVEANSRRNGTTFEEEWKKLTETNTQAVELMSAKLSETLGISQEQAVAVVKNGGLAQLTYDDLLGTLLDLNNAQEVIDFFKSMGLEVDEQFAESLAQGQPKINENVRNLVGELANAQTFDQAKKAFENAGLEVSDALVQVLGGQASVNISAAMTLLGRGVSEEAVTAFDISTISNTLDDFMKETGANLDQVVSGLLLMSGSNLNDLTEKEMEDLKGLATALGIEVGDNLGSAVPDALQKALKMGEVHVKEVADHVADVADQTVNASDMGSNAETVGKETTQKLGEGTQEAQADVEDATTNITSAVQEKYEALPDEVKPYAEKLMEYISTALADGDGTVKSAIEAVAQSAVDRAKEILGGDVGVEIAKAFIDGMSLGFEEKLNDKSLNTSAQEVIQGMVNDQVAFFENLKASDMTKTMVEGLQQGIKDTEDALTTEASTLVESFIKIFTDEINNEKGIEYGENLIEGISSGMSSEFDYDLSPEAKYVGEEVVSILEDYFSYSNGEDIAYYIMQGLVDGLSGNKSTVSKIAYSIGESLIDSMEKALGISSPSKAFKAIGNYSMQGLELGFEGKERSVLNSVSDIASAISEEMIDDTDLGYTFDGVTRGLDAVVSSLSDIAMQFVYVANAINGMGGLEIPSIAQGKTIPYGTRISNNGYEGISDLFENMTAELGNVNNDQVALLVEQNNLLRELLDKQFTVNVTPSASWGRHNAQSAKLYNKVTGG